MSTEAHQSTKLVAGGGRHDHAQDDSHFQLHQQIRHQIAYYFSDANLRRDRFMQQLTNGATEQVAEAAVEADEAVKEKARLCVTPVALAQFLSFRKINALTTREQDLYDAFADTLEFTHLNTRLQFDPTARTIARKDAFDYSDKNNVEVTARTLYVEGFSEKDQRKGESIIDFLQEKLSPFGSILSVRTPRYNNSTSRELMGFAFIEFESEESVEQACQQLRWQKDAQIEATSTPILRAISKATWNEKKKRYLKLQKDAEHSQARQSMDDSELRKIAASFDLTHKQEREKADPQVSKSKGASRSANPSYIVQLEMLSPNAASLDSATDLRKQLRNLLNDPQSSILPSEIVYIDTDSSSLQFKVDGSVIQRCFIRTVESKSAQKFTDQQFKTNFAAYFKDSPVLSSVAILNEQQVEQYWRRVGPGGKRVRRG